MRSSLFVMHFVSFVALENMHRRKKISATHLFHCCSYLLSPSGSLCCQVQIFLEENKLEKVDFLMHLTLLFVCNRKKIGKEQLM